MGKGWHLLDLRHAEGGRRWLTPPAPTPLRRWRRGGNATRKIHEEAEGYQQIYHRNGPSWTGKDGHEYEDASYVLEKTEEIARLAERAIAKAEGSEI